MAANRLEAQMAITRTAVGIVVSLAALIAIDRFAQPDQSESVRLGLTIGYFASLWALAFFLLGPRRNAVRLAIEWMYDDAPPHTAQSARRWANSIDQLVTVGTTLAMIFVGSVAIRVLAAWYEFFEPFAGTMWYVMWFSLLAILLSGFWGSFLFQDVLQQIRSLREKDALTMSYQPRTFSALFSPLVSDTPETLVINADYSFQAGGESWNWDQLHANCIVFGQTGSGKTVCVLNALLDGLLGSAAKMGVCPGGLILDPKGDFGDKLAILMARYGWQDQLRIIDPSDTYRSERWNPLDSTDDEVELASRISAVMDAAKGKKSDGDDSFWIGESTKFVRHSIALLRATNEGFPPSLVDILKLSMSFDAINERTQKLTVRTSSDEAALNFFADEWTSKADEHRTSVQGYVSNMLDAFSLEPYRTVFSGRSTVKIADAIRDGQIVYLRMPVAEKETMARVIGTAIKLEFYREVLKAVNKPRPSLFVCDEFQVFMTTLEGKGDAEFFERNRQSNHVNLIATQNLPALTRHTPNNKEPAMSLLGNCTTKIFLRNNDKETNKFASELFGQEIAIAGGRTFSPGTGRFGLGSVGTSTTDTYDQVSREDRFAILKIPSKRIPGANFCEAIIHSAANPEGADRRKTRWPLHPIH